VTFEKLPLVIRFTPVARADTPNAAMDMNARPAIADLTLADLTFIKVSKR
jgi:hypothetical protein